MAFLAPLFFVGLAALAIPVLIHLTQREKKMVQQFPSLMFVRRIPYQTVRRRKIRDLALLCVRLAALLLIVGAFARPFLWRPNAATTLGPGAREVVVLLDQSYSMAYADRWDRAKAAARDAINGLGPSDRASVVLFSSGADIALRSTAEKDRLIASFDTMTPTAAATRFGPALKVAGSILAESPLPRKEAILISDFQRSGWRGEEGSRLPTGSTLTPVSIGGPADKANATVTTVALARSTFSDQERVTVTASVANRTIAPITGDSLTLEVGGRAVQTVPLNVQPEGSASVAFAPFTLPSRNMRLTVRAGADALATDNAFNLVISPSTPVRIVVVDTGTKAGAGLFLSRALQIGDAPKFEITNRLPSAVSDDDLRRASVVLLNDVDVNAQLGRRLARFVQDGGGLFLAAGPRATWPQQDVDILPASLSQPIDKSRGESARVGALEYGHPVFEVFRAPRSGDFSSARFYAYRSVTAAPNTQVLARFDAGTPALIERKVGSGHVMLWASTLDLSWSDLLADDRPGVRPRRVEREGAGDRAPGADAVRQAAAARGRRLAGAGTGADGAGVLRDPRSEGELRRDGRREQRGPGGVGFDRTRSGGGHHGRDGRHRAERSAGRVGCAADTRGTGAFAAVVVVSPGDRDSVARRRHPLFELVIEDVNGRTMIWRV